jgi:hypothetical protein
MRAKEKAKTSNFGVVAPGYDIWMASIGVLRLPLGPSSRFDSTDTMSSLAATPELRNASSTGSNTARQK